MVVETMYCGVDIGMRRHAVGLLNKDQETISQYFIGNDLDGFRKLEKDIDKKTKICIEPTGIYSINFFIYFSERGYDIRLCETRSSSEFRKSLYGKKKDDKKDCFALAKYRITHEKKTFDGSKILNTLSYDSSDIFLSSLHDLIVLYHVKSKYLGKIKTKIKRLIDLRFPEADKVFPYNRGCKTIIKALCYSKEEILSGKLSLRKQEIIQSFLKRSIGQYDLKASEFRLLVDKSAMLDTEIVDLRGKIEDKLRRNGYSRLFDYCGLNSINVGTLVRDIQDITRFFRHNHDGSFSKKKSLRAFKNFFGIAVTSNQSGERVGGHKLVKSGCKTSRNVVMMLALTYISLKDNKKYSLDLEYSALNPVKYGSLYEEYCKRTKKMIAVTKIMNKISTDLFFVFKDAVESTA